MWTIFLRSEISSSTSTERQRTVTRLLIFLKQTVRLQVVYPQKIIFLLFPVSDAWHLHQCPSLWKGTRSVQECPASSLHLHESDNSCPASQVDRTAACDVTVHRNASLECPCLEELEFITRDIEHFEQDNCDHHVEDYLSSLGYSLTCPMQPIGRSFL